MKKLIIKTIKIYQKTLSLDHGPLKARFPQGFCRYRPTCSEYACQAIEKHGLFRGGFMGIYRVLRCNPFSKGGYDPLR